MADQIFTAGEKRRIRSGLCFECGHEDGEHDRHGCRGGEDVLCRCDCFGDPTEAGTPEEIAAVMAEGK